MPYYTALLSRDGKTDVPCLEPRHHPEFALTIAINEEMPKLCLCWEPGLLRSLAWEILLHCCPADVVRTALFSVPSKGAPGCV